MAPFSVMPMSKLRVSSQIVPIAPSTPAAPPSQVTIATSAKRPSSVLRVEPGLKPNHPNHRITTPSPTRGMEWPGITLGRPLASYFPCRAPSRSRAASAPVAPTMWITVEPAKSCIPKFACSQPPPKIQWLASG